MYPVFVGFINVMSLSSTVYVVGFVPFTEPPSRLYVMLYVFIVLEAVAVTVVAAAGIVSVVVLSVVLSRIDVSSVVHAKSLYVYPDLFSYPALMSTVCPHLYVPEPVASFVFVPAVTVNWNVFLL